MMAHAWSFPKDEVRFLRVFHFGVYITNERRFPLWGHMYDDFYKGFDAYMSSILSGLERLVDNDELVDLVVNATNGIIVTRFNRLTVQRHIHGESYIWIDYWIRDSKGIPDPLYRRRYDYKEDTHHHPDNFYVPNPSITMPFDISYLPRPFVWTPAKIEWFISKIVT